MNEEILININPQETRVAMVEEGILQEIVIERANKRGLVGNIYKGRICRVLPGMQAAFINIGLERAAFLHVSDIVGTHLENNENKEISICELIHEGQTLLVQVIKDPLGTKGARLTTLISIPSRYVVLIPYSPNMIGISARIEKEEERKRLREIVLEYMGISEQKEVEEKQIEALPQMGVIHTVKDTAEIFTNNATLEQKVNNLEGYGFIVRTAAEGVSTARLKADIAFVCRLWQDIREKEEIMSYQTLVYEDLSLATRTVRDLMDTTVKKVRIDSKAAYLDIKRFVNKFVPDVASQIEHYTGPQPIFDLYNVEEEINRALERKVYLKSGGYLVIDQTEAMTTIDVNTGAYVGSRNLEETIFKTNMEAVQTIARQLRLRNLGGIIILDFIDMLDLEHRRQVLQTLEKCLERDHTKSYLSDVSPLGLVQMTRKRTRESLEHVLCEVCPTCKGRGSIKTAETVCYEIFREILREAQQFESQNFLVLASAEIIDRLVDEESTHVAELEEFIGRSIRFQVETSYMQEQYDIVLSPREHSI